MAPWCLYFPLEAASASCHPAYLEASNDDQQTLSLSSEELSGGTGQTGNLERDGFENCYLKKVISSIATATYSDDC